VNAPLSDWVFGKRLGYMARSDFPNSDGLRLQEYSWSVFVGSGSLRPATAWSKKGAPWIAIQECT
jgi:hypothetical protein